MTGASCCRRGRSASYPTAPSRIPACSFPAPGSSELFASALVQWYWLSPLLPAVRLASRSPVIRTGGCFLCGLHSSVVRFPRPLAAGTIRRSDSPPFIGSPSLGWRYLPALRPETMGPPSFLTLLLFRATLLDPGRPSAASPFTAALCGLPASLTGSPPAFIFFVTGLDCFRETRPPLRPGTFPVYASTMPFASAPYNFSRVILLPCIAARLGTSDRLHLTQRGLAPRKKSQTYAGALTKKTEPRLNQ